MTAPQHQVQVSVAHRFRRSLPTPLVRRWALRSLRLLKQPSGVSLDIAVTGDQEVQELNRDYRGVDEPTDVLSFPYSDAAQPGPFLGGGDRPEPLADSFILPDTAGIPLGEIVIALPYAERQAQLGGHTLHQEACLLVVHGILHLLGFNHEEPGERRAMWDTTVAILAGLKVEPPPSFMSSY